LPLLQNPTIIPKAFAIERAATDFFATERAQLIVEHHQISHNGIMGSAYASQI